MESYKSILIIFLFFVACSTLGIYSTGWEYLYVNDIENAHREFLRDYAYEKNIENASGLAYTYLLLNEPDSSKVYVNICEEMDNESDYTLFVSLIYNHFYNIAKADTVYKKFVDKNGKTLNGYVIDSLISYGSMHKTGLTDEYELGNYEYVYDILQSITNIDSNLDMNNEEEIRMLISYIESIEE